ncbi:hypothetical protein GCM10008018_00140 [Paenibacillus marchantiophytorum]|uniref:Integrase catalytic domain-containing protein n=1 Tax=Paenibacillus marchantiophytorum TaxID=1619310 RepID=A0ABQ2BPQ1_9BACL|nr:hypothetical protein GCM10008018_00140 [Paenibacillus marchantiophytorum]
MAARTQDRFFRSVRVALFKNCKFLDEAQAYAETWFSNWRRDLFKWPTVRLNTEEHDGRKSKENKKTSM